MSKVGRDESQPSHYVPTGLLIRDKSMVMDYLLKVLRLILSQKCMEIPIFKADVKKLFETDFLLNVIDLQDKFFYCLA